MFNLFSTKVYVFFSALYYDEGKQCHYNNVVVCSSFPNQKDLVDFIKEEYPKAEDIFLLSVSKISKNAADRFFKK